MSRGLGRWQRLLLHELYHAPKVAPSGRKYIDATDYAGDSGELSAVCRAARSLAAKGLVRKGASSQLDPLPEPPTIAHPERCALCVPVSVQNNEDSRFFEHLDGTRP